VQVKRPTGVVVSRSSFLRPGGRAGWTSIVILDPDAQNQALRVCER
jgi:hypothetical protein